MHMMYISKETQNAGFLSSDWIDDDTLCSLLTSIRHLNYFILLIYQAIVNKSNKLKKKIVILITLNGRFCLMLRIILINEGLKARARDGRDIAVPYSNSSRVLKSVHLIDFVSMFIQYYDFYAQSWSVATRGGAARMLASFTLFGIRSFFFYIYVNRKKANCPSL